MSDEGYMSRALARPEPTEEQPAVGEQPKERPAKPVPSGAAKRRRKREKRAGEEALANVPAPAGLSERDRANTVARDLRVRATGLAASALDRLVFLLKNGSTSVQLQAARAILGMAGVSTTAGERAAAPPPPPAPLSVPLADLVALVRASKEPPPAVTVRDHTRMAGAMPLLSPGPGVPADPAAPRTGAVEADFREITGDSPSNTAGTSGSSPDGEEA